MTAVALGDAFAARPAPPQRDRGVGGVIERQQQRSREVAVAGKLEQQPSHHQSDRQAAAVAEKELRHRPVEWRKAEHGAEKRQRDQRGRLRHRTEQRENVDAGRDRHGLRHGDPVDAVHEVDEIDEPQQRDGLDGPLDDERHDRQRTQVRRHRRDDGDDRDGLQRKARQRRQREDVVGDAEPHQQRRADGEGRQRDEALRLPQPCDGDERDEAAEHHRDTAALRRRRFVGGARVGARQRIAREQRPHHHDQRGAGEAGHQDYHEVREPHRRAAFQESMRRR